MKLQQQKQHEGESNMRNEEVKNYAKAKGVHLWEVAESIGITDSTFSRRLRKEMQIDEMLKMKNVIDEICTLKGKGGERDAE
jgi:predicted XRE-type DNA-binding protein